MSADTGKAMRDGVHNGMSPTTADAFADETVIVTYTEEQAIADGIKLQLGPRLFCTTNLARRLAPSPFQLHPQPQADPQAPPASSHGYDLDTLRRKVIGPLLRRYCAGVFCDPGATNYPEEADHLFACYLVGTERVWAILDGVGLHFILPEDY